MAPRSGLASKHFIDTGAGVIDADYRGEVKVLLFNFSEVDFTIQQGDRIAQLVLERVGFFPFLFFILLVVLFRVGLDANFLQIYTPEVAVVEELEESVRGAGGFGSTGS